MKNENELKRVAIQLAVCPGVCASEHMGEACKICQYKCEQNCTDLLRKNLLDLVQNTQKESVVDLEIRVTQIIHELGIPASIMGYQYVRYALMLVVRDPSLINSVTGELYPAVAERFGTTGSRVERAIRHAVEVAWQRGDVDTLQKWFGWTVSNTKGKPTNSEFIALVADVILLERKKEVE